MRNGSVEIIRRDVTCVYVLHMKRYHHTRQDARMTAKSAPCMTRVKDVDTWHSAWDMSQDKAHVYVFQDDVNAVILVSGLVREKLQLTTRADTECSSGDSSPVAANYDSDSDDTRTHDGPAHRHRHPLELLATRRFIAEDLLRRAGVSPSALQWPSRSSPEMEFQSVMSFSQLGFDRSAGSGQDPPSPPASPARKKSGTGSVHAMVKRVSSSLPRSPLSRVRGAIKNSACIPRIWDAAPSSHVTAPDLKAPALF